MNEAQLQAPNVHVARNLYTNAVQAHCYVSNYCILNF